MEGEGEGWDRREEEERNGMGEEGGEGRVGKGE